MDDYATGEGMGRMDTEGGVVIVYTIAKGAGGSGRGGRTRWR